MSAYVDQVSDTICALITAPGKAGVSVHRVSGSDSLRACRNIMPTLPATLESHRVYFLYLKDRYGDVIDEALVTFFSEGKSFTGDQTLEISTHGGIAVANKVLSELTHFGCRPAERGEFSFRAFYNGKLDLVQAEGILGLIHSETEAARKSSLMQLQGALSKKIISIEDLVLKILAQLEAAIDFSTEDIEPYSLKEILSVVDEAILQTQPLVESFERGRVISDGLRVVICGPPNVGKSSLYNAILGKDRSIVSSVPGTTRDFIEYRYSDFGLPVHIVDTAGLRPTVDDIESQGIERSFDQIKAADLAIVVLDATNYKNMNFNLPTPHPKSMVLVFNKMDLVAENQFCVTSAAEYAKNHLAIQAPSAIFTTSVKNNLEIQSLTRYMQKTCLVDIDQQEALVTQYRQADHLSRALTALLNARELISQTSSYDLVAIEMQESLRNIYAVLGKEFDDQVLDRVFKEFCIGK